MAETVIIPALVIEQSVLNELVASAAELDGLLPPLTAAVRRAQAVRDAVDAVLHVHPLQPMDWNVLADRVPGYNALEDAVQRHVEALDAYEKVVHPE